MMAKYYVGHNVETREPSKPNNIYHQNLKESAIELDTLFGAHAHSTRRERERDTLGGKRREGQRKNKEIKRNL